VHLLANKNFDVIKMHGTTIQILDFVFIFCELLFLRHYTMEAKYS